MYLSYNGRLCVEASFLFGGEDEIISQDLFKKLCQRKKLTKVTVGGNGRKALVEFETMREDIKQAVIDRLGNPKVEASYIRFMDFIKTDQSAVAFFDTYTIPSTNQALPEKTKLEYCANAAILNACRDILASSRSKRMALDSKTRPWSKIAPIIQELPRHQWPHTLPANERTLQRKYKSYLSEGYGSLVHKQFGHKNAEKLDDEAKSWVLARWSDPVRRCANYGQLLREYNEIAAANEWKPIKSEQSLMNFLQNPAVEAIWAPFRFGELKTKERHSYHHSTIMASMRDSLWYSDGTKLNYYYRDENGKVQTCQVYEVFDTYSEVFLGYHISKTEDFHAQYYAFKMAIQVAQHKPYEIKFDGQGGHKKLETNSFLSKISRITTKTQPYNGKSKTIESAFGRFQMQFLKQDWFFTGQNITAKRDESRANMEFITRNAASLPTLDEVKQIYSERRKQWNSAPHYKTGIPRIEMYLSSQNPAAQPVGIWDLVNMFWIQRDKAVTCLPGGISFREKNVEYEYVVQTEDGLPDLQWINDNVGKKFIVKYDPDDMTSIHLYEDTPHLGLRWVVEAKTKFKIHRNRQEQTDGEASFIRKIDQGVKNLRLQNRDKAIENLEKHGMDAESYGLTSPPVRGIENRRKTTQKIDIGTYQKAVSNADPIDTEQDIYSFM